MPDYRKSLFRETIREAVHDKYKLAGSLVVDGYGSLSTIAYIFGGVPGMILDIKDSATALGQTGWILAAYWNDLTTRQKKIIAGISLAEEWLPGITDLIPSATIAHCVAARNRTKKNLKQEDEKNG